MKLFKKLMSYFIALTMVLSLATLLGGNVHADSTTGTENPTTYTLTLKGTAKGHTYEAYQVFKGDLSGNTLSNIQWGTGIDSTKKVDLIQALKDDTTLNNEFGSVTDAASVAKALEGVASNSAEMDAFAQVVGQYLSTTSTSQSSSVNETETKITGLAAGYYLVKDQDGSQKDKSDAYTKFIVQVVGNAKAAIKSDVPTVEKKVKDINDSEKSSETKPKNPTDWQDSADYDIGDWVPYQITGTMPSNINDYKTYSYKFTDTMSKGLTFDEDNTEKNYKATHKAKITLDGIDVTSSFEEKITHNTDETTTVEWSCSNLKGINKNAGDTSENAEKLPVTENSKVVVTYSARLNESAVIGSAGNPNKVDLTYSNNPNNSGKGETGKTPEDKNIVFTYAAKFNKVDGSGNPLGTAKFTLYKFTTEKKDGDVAGSHGNTKGYWHSLGEKEATIQADKQYTAYYKGLDDGVYKLVETHTPDGYNTMADKIFTVSATHNDGDEPSFGTLTVDDLTTTISNGTFSSDIENKSGSILPSTGGMGTTLLYVAGGILVACAAAYVVLNKKRA